MRYTENVHDVLTRLLHEQEDADSDFIRGTASTKVAIEELITILEQVEELTQIKYTLMNDLSRRTPGYVVSADTPDQKKTAEHVWRHVQAAEAKIAADDTFGARSALNQAIQVLGA